jgi:hypothetical protein
MGIFSETVTNSTHPIPMPVLVFPGGPLIGRSVREIVSNPEVQFETQRALHQKFRTRVVMSAMDLSVEAEEFGSKIRFSDQEVPTGIGRLLTDAEGVNGLEIPPPWPQTNGCLSGDHSTPGGAAGQTPCRSRLHWTSFSCRSALRGE